MQPDFGMFAVVIFGGALVDGRCWRGGQTPERRHGFDARVGRFDENRHRRMKAAAEWRAAICSTSAAAAFAVQTMAAARAWLVDDKISA